MRGEILAHSTLQGSEGRDSLDDADIAGHAHRQDDDAGDADAQLEALLQGLPIVWKWREAVSLQGASQRRLRPQDAPRPCMSWLLRQPLLPALSPCHPGLPAVPYSSKAQGHLRILDLPLFPEALKSRAETWNWMPSVQSLTLPETCWQPRTRGSPTLCLSFPICTMGLITT